jgi:carbamoyl-phosphate synthase large subunit
VDPLNILVLAVGGNVSQGILKGLRPHRRPLRIVGADISSQQMGLYTVDAAYVSPWAHEPEFLPWLIDTCRAEDIKAILSGAEPVLMALAQHQQQIESETGAKCLCSPLGVLEIGDDKLKTCRWLEENELPVPAYADARDSTSVDALVAKVGYPLIAKPRRGGGARGVILVENELDLEYVCRKEDYLLQEHVGTENDEYTVGCFSDREGQFAPSCCMRRELLAGTTYRAHLGEFTEVRNVAEKIARKLRPEGPCNVQLRMTTRGPVCFEINPRFSGTTPIRDHFGYREVWATLDHYLFDEPVQLPLVTEGVALRYWNELYVTPEVPEAKPDTGALPPSGAYRVEVEDYGLEP